MTSLRDVLAGARVDGADEVVVRAALKSPWCWPGDGASLQILGQQVSRPEEPKVGDVLLVSASPGRQALWRIRRWTQSDLAQSQTCLYPFHTDQWLARLEAGAITAALPFVIRCPNRAPEEWRAELIRREGFGRDDFLHGKSYGVSMALALGSIYMDEPVPADLAASAVVNDDGELGPVERLDQKIALIGNWALGVRRFLVAQVQREDAVVSAQRLAPKLMVVAARSVSDAFDVVFEGYRAAGAPRWRTSGRAKEVAKQIYWLAMRSPSLRDWGAVERPAEVLCSILESGTPDHDNMLFAAAIAKRHQGKIAPLPWLESETTSLQKVAHVIQAATDSGNPELADWVEKAKRHLTARHSSEDLVLMGAIGRAQAALGDYQGARSTLKTAVEGWLNRGQPKEAGRPLCELLRVLGLRGEAADVKELDQWIAKCLAECQNSSDSVAAGYLILAWGRAWVQLGSALEALERLREDTHWEGTAPDLQDSRARWLVRALELAKDYAEASKRRATLRQKGDDNRYALLSQMDYLLLGPENDHAEGELGRLLDLLQEIDPSVARLRNRVEGGGNRAQAECVTREHPY